MNTINPIAQAAQEIAGYQQAMRQTGSGTASVQATQLARWRAALEQAIQPQAEALTDEQRLGWYAWRVKDLEEKLANAQKQPPTEAVPADFRDRLVAISQAIADQDDRAAQAMIREILAAPQQAEAVPFFADYFKRIYEFLSSVAPSGIADEAFRNIPEAIFAASERNRISGNVEQVRAESKPLSGIDGSPFEGKKGDGYVMSAAPQQAEAVPEVRNLLDRHERAWHRMGELWERCQGKGWPEAESSEFTRLRDELTPAIRQQLVALAAPQQAEAAPSSDLNPDEGDPVTLWAEIWRLREAVKGPDGYATWQDAATAERIRRVRAESKQAEEAKAVPTHDDTDLIKQMLEALRSCSGVSHWPALVPTINAARKRLEAPQQAEAVPGDVTDAMVDAYLKANDAYWRETDTQPKSPTKWRNGNPKEATRVSLAAAIVQQKGPQP